MKSYLHDKIAELKCLNWILVNWPILAAFQTVIAQWYHRMDVWFEQQIILNGENMKHEAWITNKKKTQQIGCRWNGTMT